VSVRQDEIVEIDAVNHALRSKSGKRYSYDRLVVSPGIDFRWNSIAGYDAAARSRSSRPT